MHRSVKHVLRWTLIGVVAAPLVLLGAFIAWLFIFFNSGIFFSGDGEYRHPGSRGAAFEVTFPEIDTSVPQTQTYEFTRLAPTIGWVVGVRSKAAMPDAVVRLTLTNEHGEKVFEQSVVLSNGSRLASVEGTTREVPIDSHGSVRIEALGKGADAGWGTHFEPRWLGRYSLRAEILRTSSHRNSLAQVVMEAYTAGP